MAEEIIEKNMNKGEGFFTYMFDYDDDTKNTVASVP